MTEFKNVSFFYGDKKVIDNISFKIEKGEHVCIFGPSGSGKTTVLSLLTGINTPKEGEIARDFKSVSFVFQEDRLLPFLTVLKNVALFSDEPKAKEVLYDLGLKNVINAYPKSLSGGMARRAALARALAKKADIYIFDEPFTGLDVKNREKAVEAIKKYTENKTVILVTHEKADAKSLECGFIYL